MQQPSTDCPMADSILNSCNNVMDAAQYIGVTFDVRKGYNTEGYRNQILLTWCSTKKKFRNELDVPDFMHVQGVYETTMGTEAFNNVEEENKVVSDKSNTRMGQSSFSEDKVSLSKMNNEKYCT